MEASMRKSSIHPELCKRHNGMDDGAFEFSHRVKPAHDLGKVRATETVDLFKVEHIYLSIFPCIKEFYWKSLMISQRVTSPIQLTYLI